MSTKRQANGPADDILAKRRKYDDLQVIEFGIRQVTHCTNEKDAVQFIHMNRLIVRCVYNKLYDEILAVAKQFPIIFVELLEFTTIMDADTKPIVDAMKSLAPAVIHKLFLDIKIPTAVLLMLSNGIIGPTHVHQSVDEVDESKISRRRLNEFLSALSQAQSVSQPFAVDIIDGVSITDETKCAMIGNLIESLIPIDSQTGYVTHLCYILVQRRFHTWTDIFKMLWCRKCVETIRYIISSNIDLPAASLLYVLTIQTHVKSAHYTDLTTCAIAIAAYSIRSNQHELTNSAVRRMLKQGYLILNPMYCLPIYQNYVSGRHIAPGGLLKFLMQTPELQDHIASRECGIKGTRRYFGRDVGGLIAKYL